MVSDKNHMNLYLRKKYIPTPAIIPPKCPVWLIPPDWSTNIKLCKRRNRPTTHAGTGIKYRIIFSLGKFIIKKLKIALTEAEDPR